MGRATPQEIGGGHFRDLSRDWEVAWARHTQVTSPDVAAAWLQYRLAQIVWTAIREERTSLGAIAKLMGESAENQRKKLAGDGWASLSDLLGWTFAFSDDLSIFELGAVAEAFPDTYEAVVGGFRTGRQVFPDLSAIADIDWPTRLRTAAAHLQSRSTGKSAQTITSEVLRHLVAQQLVESGINEDQLRPHDIRSRSVARLDIGLDDARAQIDSVVVASSLKRTDAHLIWQNAIARAADDWADRGQGRAFLLVLAQSGSPDVGGALPGLTAHRTDAPPSSTDSALPAPVVTPQTIGPLTASGSVTEGLRVWWARHSVQLSVLDTIGVEDATLWLLEIHSRSEA